MNGIVQELDTGQVSNTLSILPLNQEVINQTGIVLEDGSEVVGVGQGAGDGLVGPGAGPLVPDSDTTLELNTEMVVSGQKALLGKVRLPTTGVRQGSPGGRSPVGRAGRLLNKVKDDRTG